MQRELAHRRGTPEHAAGDAAQRLLERGELVRAHLVRVSARARVRARARARVRVRVRGRVRVRVRVRVRLFRAHVDAGAHHAEAVVDRHALAAAGREL